MGPLKIPKKALNEESRYAVGFRPIDRTMQRLVALTGETANQDLLLEMMASVAKVGRERFTRGDFKVINTTLKELRYAFKVFKPYRNIRKAAVFGSARTSEKAPIYRSARDFAGLMVKNGWMVISGGSTGIMKAVQEGGTRAHSFGLNIRLPKEQSVNSVIQGDRKLIHFKYFFTRKLCFIKESDATVLYPGGFGTHDEGMESITLTQTGKNNPRPIVCVDVPQGNYWDTWFKFIRNFLLRKGMIDKDDPELITLVKDPAKACQIILNFYNVYHSLRYVKQWTVLRLNKEVTEDHLKRLNKHFSSLLVTGRIEKSKPLHEEADEPELQTLPRLKLCFDRRSYGKLKRMIDCLNEG